MAIKKVLLISTGGTIAGNIAGNENQVDANTFSKLLNNVSKMVKNKWNIDLEVSAEDLEENGKALNLDSSDILPKHWRLLSNTVRENYDNYDAFVITHGTNTLGYTSAALSFAFENIDKPVILTGSQVPMDFPGADAMMNLENAIRVAIWPYDKIRGVIVVFGSRIISGTRVKKETEFDYDSFSSFSTVTTL